MTIAAIHYRVLVCSRCRARIEVVEIPRGWIDPFRYVCGSCLEGGAPQLSLAVEQEPRRETPKYDPEQAQLPI